MTAVNDVVDLSYDDDVAIVSVDSPPVNALSAAVRQGIFDAFEEANGSDASAIVLICRGRTFIAGADISEFGTNRAGAPLLNVQGQVEGSPKPVVAAIHGTALGGGLELALCAHYRIGVPSARCGLPEVNLGLLPGAGGTQRLPRIVGVEKALELITGGDHVPAPQCLEMGLLDEMAGEDSLEADALAFARRIVAEGRPLKRIRDNDENLESAKGKPEIFSEFRAKHARKFRGFEAPEAIIQCIEAAVELPFDEAIGKERELFTGLVNGAQSAAQRYVFFAERQVWKIPDVPKDTEVIPINKVGVIGAGTMGGGITMNFVNAGIPVTLIETSQEAIDRGLGVVKANYDRSASRGRFTAEEVDERMARITPSLDMNDLADVDMVVEAVFERMDVKKDIFAKLDEICKPGAVLATNTSALDIDEIATATTRPESVIGMHFFSPANVMRLVEVVRADKTSIPVIHTTMTVSKQIGKIAGLVRVCPGFVGNRILAARRRASEALVEQGVMPWQIDGAIRDFGFAMGPYQMSDLAGLDLGWVAEEATGTIRDQLNLLGRKGQKTGAGYYDYDENRTPTPSPITEEIVREFAAASGREPREFSDDEIVDHLTLAMVNEGAKILDEGMAIRSSDIDIIWIYGYNWPRYRGGPMHWADAQGLDVVVAKLEALVASDGSQWEPAPLLRKLASEGKKFQDHA